MDLQVAVGLWIASYIGSLLNFLTLAYVGKLFTANYCLWPFYLVKLSMFSFFFLTLLCRGSSQSFSSSVV